MPTSPTAKGSDPVKDADPATPTYPAPPLETPELQPDDAIGEGGERHQRAEKDGPVLTDQQGHPVATNQNSITAGNRGPVLMQDHVLRDKLFHFDHERIPERVVHARGTGAHGVFETYESLAELTMAGVARPTCR